MKSPFVLLGLAAISLGLAGCPEDERPATPEAAGAKVFQSSGCGACHGADGQGSSGPALKGLAGTSVQLIDGSTVTADAEYLKRAITDPNAEKVTGFSMSMPKKSLSTQEVDDLVAYLQSLK